MKTTKTIAGHDITLTPGRRYYAWRRMARRGQIKYPVTITDITDARIARGVNVGQVRELNYDQANELLNAFNNGPTSFDGRVW